jgi:hypothetical protein
MYSGKIAVPPGGGGLNWEMFFIQIMEFAQIMLVQVVLKNYLSSLLLILNFWWLFNGQSLEEIV